MSALRLGEEIPDFECEDHTNQDFRMHQYIQGCWALLVACPADFSPVDTVPVVMMPN